MRHGSQHYMTFGIYNNNDRYHSLVEREIQMCDVDGTGAGRQAARPGSQFEVGGQEVAAQPVEQAGVPVDALGLGAARLSSPGPARAEPAGQAHHEPPGGLGEQRQVERRHRQ